MDVKLSTIAASQGGVITRRQALDAGLSDLEVSQHLRSRRWTAVRRGAYIETAVWRTMTDADRHAARSHAVVLSLKPPVALSHWSACVMLDAPLWQPDLTDVHVTRPRGVSTRREAGVWHHSAALPDDQLITRAGVPLTSAGRTIIDTARISSFEAGVVVADGLLHSGAVTPAQLLALLNSMRDFPGSRNAGRVVEFADGLSESVGESRTRILMEIAGLPRPELQVTLETGDRADFLIRAYRTVVEFDGKQKYGRLLAPGDDPAEVVWREKKREDRLRDAGYEVVRIIWSELTMVALVARRILTAFSRAQRRHGLHPAA